MDLSPTREIPKPAPGPLRIAMVAACPFPWPRGTPLRIQQMAEALTQRGHQVHVVTYHLGGDVTTAPYAVHRIPAVPGYRVHAPGPTYRKLLVLDPLLGSKLLQVVRRHRIDVVHAHHYEGLLVASTVCRLTGTPFLYDAHTLLESELPYYGLGLTGPMKRTLGRWLDRSLPRRAAHVVTVNESIRGHLIESAGLEPERVDVVASSVEPEWLEGLARSPRPSAETERCLVFTGNLAPYQGIALLLQAFREIRTRRRDVRLVLVTDGPLGPYSDRAAALGIDDALEVRPADTATVQESLVEAAVLLNPRPHCDGTPQKLLNYMAAGRPIVSFRGSGAMLEAERTALLVEDGDVKAFADAVLRLLDDPELAAILGRNARRFVEMRLRAEQAAARIESIYRSVLDRN